MKAASKAAATRFNFTIPGSAVTAGASHKEKAPVHLASRLNWLRAGVMGANDGIVSTAGIVAGVAGAAVSEHALLAAESPQSPRERFPWPRANTYQSRANATRSKQPSGANNGVSPEMSTELATSRR